MYLEYYGFKKEPFNITPDSSFLFLSKRHREALASLLYGIEQRKGFIALTGEIGCGKTTICRALLGKLDRERVHLALILNPQLSDTELLQAINSEFGLAAQSNSKRELLDELNGYLLEQYKNDNIVVLVIDEAQQLSPEALEQVRLLSNLETETAKLIQIALVGQPELAELLDLPELEQLNQRITVRTHIEPLNIEEVTEYIAHRLALCEPRAEVSFTKKAIKKVFEYSAGVPRRINVICDRTLLVTYVRGEREVVEDNVIKAIEELGGMPKRHRNKPKASAPSQAETPRPMAVPPAAQRESGEPHRTSNPWPLGIAILLGLAAIAYAIGTLRDPKDGAVVVSPPEPRPTPVEIADAPAPTPAPTASVSTPEPMGKTIVELQPPDGTLPSEIPDETPPSPEVRLPRKVGVHPETGQYVLADIGPRGPYLRHGRDVVLLQQADPAAISLEEAIVLIAEDRAARIAPPPGTPAPTDAQPIEIVSPPTTAPEYNPAVPPIAIAPTPAPAKQSDGATTETALKTRAEQTLAPPPSPPATTTAPIAPITTDTLVAAVPEPTPESTRPPGGVPPTPTPPSTPAPEPSPTAKPTTAPTTATPEPTRQSMLAELMNSPTPTPQPPKPWSYDGDGIVRVASDELTYPASVLTWLALTTGERLPDSELELLRGMKVEQVAALKLTEGRAPLYLREARFASNLDTLPPERFPALVQVDNNAAGFGPWAVLLSIENDTVRLRDPRTGRVQVPLELLEDHLTAVVVPFFDREAITGLKPFDRGDRVTALQNRLKKTGLYTLEPSGVFDPFTEAVVRRYREKLLLPGDSSVDPMMALNLLSETDDRQ